MDLHWIAQVLLGIYCILQGVATIVLDMNRTHAAHPQWLGHARFHVVWQTSTFASLTILEVILLWIHGPLESERFYLVTILASMPMIGFFSALVTRHLYGGTLFDPGGIPPLRVTLRGRQLRFDMNLVAEIAGSITLVTIVLLHHWAQRR